MPASANPTHRTESLRSVSLDSIRAAHRNATSPAAADHHSDAPRPVRNLPSDPRPKRVSLPKKASAPKAPRGKERLIQVAVDNTARAGLAYSTVAATAVTEPIAATACGLGALGGITCGLISCVHPREYKDFAQASGLGAVKKVSKPVSYFLCTPCIGGPSIERLRDRDIMSDKIAKRWDGYIHPWKAAREKLNKDR